VNYSLSLKAILQLYSAPLDADFWGMSSLNERQIGPFVKGKLIRAMSNA